MLSLCSFLIYFLSKCDSEDVLVYTECNWVPCIVSSLHITAPPRFLLKVMPRWWSRSDLFWKISYCVWYNTEPYYSTFRPLLCHLCIEICLKNKCRPHRFQLYQIKMCKDSLYCHQPQCYRGQVNSSVIEIRPKPDTV